VILLDLCPWAMLSSDDVIGDAMEMTLWTNDVVLCHKAVLLVVLCFLGCVPGEPVLSGLYTW